MNHTTLDMLIANENPSFAFTHSQNNDQALFNQLWRAESK